jgi:hypothetical protein
MGGLEQGEESIMSNPESQTTDMRGVVDLILKSYSEQDRVALAQAILPDGCRVVRTVTSASPPDGSTETRNHFYRDVPKLGNVAVSRHAQASMIADGISQEAFDRVLLHPTKPDVPDGADVVWRERDGLRLVILLNPTPNTGAKLVKTVFRTERQAKARSIR